MTQKSALWAVLSPHNIFLIRNILVFRSPVLTNIFSEKCRDRQREIPAAPVSARRQDAEGRQRPEMRHCDMCRQNATFIGTFRHSQPKDSRPLALMPTMRPRPIQEGDDKNGTEPQQSLKKNLEERKFCLLLQCTSKLIHC